MHYLCEVQSDFGIHGQSNVISKVTGFIHRIIVQGSPHIVIQVEFVNFK